MKTKLSFVLCVMLMSWPISGFTQPVSLDSKLKPCQGTSSKKWTNCFGVIDFETGWSLSAEFKNGLANGQGIHKDLNGDVYIGQWKDHMKHGQGTMNYSNGDKFVGQYKNDLRDGEGKLTYVECCFLISVSGGSYVGQFKNNKEEGQGTRIFHNGDKYVGQYKNGLQDGQGTYTFMNGDKYVGQYKNGLRDGQGTITFMSGDKYVGQFKNGEEHGQGMYYYLSDNEFKGALFVGEFKEGYRDGSGTYTDKNGKKIIGIWEKDKLIKNESPLPPIITLSCPNDRGRMQGVEFQFYINEDAKKIVSSRGQSPKNILITPTLIQFQQDEVVTSINRVSGLFSMIYQSTLFGSGTCVTIDQVKPKF